MTINITTLFWSATKARKRMEWRERQTQCYRDKHIRTGRMKRQMRERTKSQRGTDARTGSLMLSLSHSRGVGLKTKHHHVE